jgi:hypothetical protein
MPNTIYWIITTSLVPNNYDLRKQQYIRAITKTIEKTRDNPTIKIILVENNNNTETFLNIFQEYCLIYYTNNNSIDCNYGTREIIDVQDCIKHFNIQDDDYIVKQTGRYYLSDECPFLNEIHALETTKYECIIKYGWWEKPSLVKVEDCISGLFCMKAKYAKTVENSYEYDFAEYRWARASLKIPDERVSILKTLGIYIDPGKSSSYFIV